MSAELALCPLRADSSSGFVIPFKDGVGRRGNEKSGKERGHFQHAGPSYVVLHYLTIRISSEEEMSQSH